MKLKSFLSVIWGLWICTTSALANDDAALKVHFTFESIYSTVGNHAGTLCNGASLTEIAGVPILSLGSNDGYFDMGASVGDVIATLDQFTISTDVYIPTSTSLGSNGNFIYTFANSTNISFDANGCIFFRAGATDTRYAISKTHWGDE
jgi:hypothetical protein